MMTNLDNVDLVRKSIERSLDVLYNQEERYLQAREEIESRLTRLQDARASLAVALENLEGDLVTPTADPTIGNELAAEKSQPQATQGALFGKDILMVNDTPSGPSRVRLSQWCNDRSWGSFKKGSVPVKVAAMLLKLGRALTQEEIVQAFLEEYNIPKQLRREASEKLRGSINNLRRTKAHVESGGMPYGLWWNGRHDARGALFWVEPDVRAKAEAASPEAKLKYEAPTSFCGRFRSAHYRALGLEK